MIRHVWRSRGSERRWKHKTKTSNKENTASNLADDFVEDLLVSAETTSNEAEAETEKEVGEDGAQYGGSDDVDEVSLDEDGEQDDFDDGSECGLGKYTEDMR